MAQPQPAEGPAPPTSTWVSSTLPRRFLQLPCFRGYGQPEPHPLYRTSNQEYGRRAPTAYEVPISYRVTSHAFSDDLAQRGMYRNDGLNTSLEKSRVTGPANFITPYDTLNFHPSFKVGGPSHC
uniref:Chromosome 9 open reading frame 116 n=1 Tax=Pavo cristatus TaxID=9049 RepID=A0A8C9G1N3_PAVCR